MYSVVVSSFLPDTEKSYYEAENCEKLVVLIGQLCGVLGESEKITIVTVPEQTRKPLS